MEYENIGDIYSANSVFRRELLTLLDSVGPDEAIATAGDGKWSVQKLAEHIAIVNSGTLRICSKLLGQAIADGKIRTGV